MRLKFLNRDKLLRDEPWNMTRVDVIHYLLKGRRKASYLEVGVRRGDCFCEINAYRKVAVDPLFQLKQRRYWKLKNIFSSSYFQCTSDDFFNWKPSVLQPFEFDVIFLDGLHTYTQSFRDVQNSLKCLKHDGWIVLHDSNPPNAAAAAPAISYEDALRRFDLEPSKGAWNGEVWKTAVRLRSEERGLCVFVLDCDEGLALIRRGVPNKTLTLTPDEIASMTYEDLERQRVELLDLRPPEYLFRMEM